MLQTKVTLTLFRRRLVLSVLGGPAGVGLLLLLVTPEAGFVSLLATDSQRCHCARAKDNIHTYLKMSGWSSQWGHMNTPDGGAAVVPVNMITCGRRFPRVCLHSRESRLHVSQSGFL